jgi:pyrimidine operon attenuation protein/uracil phosphoribosyltransferase
MPEKSTLLLDKKAVDRTITRIAHEILERNMGHTDLCLIGIRTRGVFLSERVNQKIKKIEDTELPTGILDITMYRDDIFKLKSPEVKKTEIPFDVNNMIIVLVDDVMQTGRTARAAIDALMDLGRPKKIQLAVLVDRGGRELPIQPDYVGIHYNAPYEEQVLVRLREVDKRDEVVVVSLW